MLKALNIIVQQHAFACICVAANLKAACSFSQSDAPLQREETCLSMLDCRYEHRDLLRCAWSNLSTACKAQR